jgi:hypothetical protein
MARRRTGHLVAILLGLALCTCDASPTTPPSSAGSEPEPEPEPELTELTASPPAACDAPPVTECGATKSLDVTTLLERGPKGTVEVAGIAEEVDTASMAA